MSDPQVPARDRRTQPREAAARRETRRAGPPSPEIAPSRGDEPEVLDRRAVPPGGEAPAPRNKEQAVETLRGIAIILMVMGHVVGSTSAGGLRVPEDSWYRYLYLTLAPMRMPLFTVISGYVYACRPVVPGRAVTFLRGKARRILLPLVSVATIQYVFSTFGPEVSRPRELSDIWRIYYLPFDQFWFLQAIALVFLSVFVLERAGLMRSHWKWSACLLGTATLYLAEPEARIFSVDGWGRLFVFFVLGIGIKRFAAVSAGRGALAVGLGVFVLATVAYQLTLTGRIDLTHWTRMLTLGCGLGATFLLFRFRFVYRPLAWLGGYAFTIYLLHSFAVVASRILGKRMLEIEETEPLLAAGMILGLGLPIAGHEVFARMPWTRRVILGLR